MLIIRCLRIAELFLSSALEHLKEALSIVIDRIYQVNRVINQPLLDHIVQKSLTWQSRARINLNQPALKILVEDYIEAIQIEAVRVERYVILSCN